MKSWIVLATLLVLSGCTTHYANVTEDYQYSGESDEGIVLVSITEVDYKNLWERRWFPHIKMSRKGHGDEGSLSSFAYGANYALGRRQHKNDTDNSDKNGTLLAITVKAGDYQIDSAGIFIDGYSTWVAEDWQPIYFYSQSWFNYLRSEL